MDRKQAIDDIKARWKELYPADKDGKGIICPICHSGEGAHGTGISEWERSRNHFLKCHTSKIYSVKPTLRHLMQVIKQAT